MVVVVVRVSCKGIEWVGVLDKVDMSERVPRREAGIAPPSE